MPANPEHCPDKLAERAVLSQQQVTRSGQPTGLIDCPDCGLTVHAPGGQLPPHPCHHPEEAR